MSTTTRFIARTDAPDGSSAAYAVIAVTQACRTVIARRRQLFENARLGDAALSELRFHSEVMVIWFDSDHAPGDPDGDYAELPAGTRVRVGCATRTEGDSMIVGADGVSWTAGPKGEDGWVTSREIAYADLLDPAQLCAALSAEEHAALGYAARILGNGWKGDIEQRWRKGRLQTLPLAGATLATLQRLGTTLGPRGLAAYAGKG